MKVVMYGIKNCDTVKKAIGHIQHMGHEIEFYDYKKTSPTEEQIARWAIDFGELPVNKKGTTYKKVSAEFEALKTEKAKIKFMIENSSMIIRPIIEDHKTQKILAIGKSFESIK
ncbi:MAG: arsenate reductase [Bacteriovoracaceae bacterium]|jgi:arsenate reductase-like glutaredoxin family protein|nr:arsenate reductase [Bacteriovoracaceae bacterium]